MTGVQTCDLPIFHVSGGIPYLLPEPVGMIDAETGEIREQLDMRREKGSSHDNRMYLAYQAYDFPKLDFAVTYGIPVSEGQERICAQFNARFTFSSEFVFAAGSCSGIYRLDRDGVIQWIYESNSNATPPMALLDGTLYVLFNSGEIHAIDAATGKNRGSLLLSQPLPGIYWGSDEPARSIHTSGDAIIVTFGNQQCWAFSDKRCCMGFAS